MAIARDTSSSGNAVAGTSVSFNYTTSGANRILFVAANVSTNGAGDVITGATYNNVAMTLITKHANVSTNFSGRWQYLFYLINPASGTNSVVVNASGSVTLGGVAASYSGAKQTSQPDSFNSGANKNVSSLAVSTTVVASNSWLVGFSTGTAVRPGAGTGFNLLTNDTTGNSLIGDSNGVVGTGAQSMTTTQADSTNDNGDIAMIIASFSPAPASNIVNTNRAFFMN